MTLRFAERIQNALDKIEKRAPTFFLGTAFLVALVTLWGL